MNMNLPVLVSMALSPTCIKNVWKIHRLLSKNKEYKFKNLVSSGQYVLNNERIVRHQGKYIVSSFIPPINTRAFAGMIDGVPGSGSNLFENLVAGKRKAPVSVSIEVTSRYPTSDINPGANTSLSNKDMDKESIIRLLNEIQDMGVGIIGFTGGEPLLRNDLEEIISHVDNRSVCYVYSTGYGLTSQRARSLKSAGLLGVSIDIQSSNQSIHNAIMGFNGAYEYAVNAVENSKRSGLYTISNSTCTRYLIKEEGLYRLARFLKDIGVDEMRLMELMPFGSHKVVPGELLNDEEKKELIEFHKYNKYKGLPKISVIPYYESQEMFGCGAGGHHSFIDDVGDLYPCDFIPFSFGNVFDTPIKALWKKMCRSMEVPMGHCCSKAYAKQMGHEHFDRHTVKVKTLPENCKLCDQQILPGFYKVLKGERE